VTVTSGPDGALPSDAPSSGEQMLSSALEASHRMRPDELPVLAARAAAAIGGRDVTLYLIDHEQRMLMPFLPPGAPEQPALSVDTTVAGRAFRSDRLVGGGEGEAGGENQLWAPIVDGAERLGVMGIVVDQPDELALRRCGALSTLLAELLAARGSYGDHLERVRRRREMALAAEMRWSMLPPLTFIGQRVALSGMLEPAYDIAGDAFDYAINVDLTHVAILDAMGHGMEASLMASLAISAYRHSRRRDRDLAETYHDIDDAIAGQFGADRFVTGQLARLDCDTGRLSWLAAGHPRPLLLRGNRIVGELDCQPGLPMGLGGSPSEVSDTQLEPGDRVLLYSDGMVEARSPDGELFGMERLADLLERAAASELPLPEVCRRLVHSVLDHQASTLQDDATVLLLEWEGPASAGDPVPEGP
jgi:serine phosphatase RsbU (regulator of sigma subunit)